MEVTIICDLISEMVSHRVGVTWFIRSKSLDWAHTPGGMWMPEAGLLGSILDVCLLPQWGKNLAYWEKTKVPVSKKWKKRTFSTPFTHSEPKQMNLIGWVHSGSGQLYSEQRCKSSSKLRGSVQNQTNIIK